MPKRKATKAELESGIGIGEAEVEENGIEPEESDGTQIIGLEADEEEK